jgi:tetratricopeptide (TPR) repeat protein
MRRALLALLVLVAVAAVFAPALPNGFVNFDDDRYVTENEVVARGLSGDGLRWALTSFHASNWHPLTWLSHMLDVELFELEPRGHHATSVLLHAVASALLFLFLERSTKRDGPALLAALLFGLHPLRVESVAWVAERKDVLAGALLFALLVVHGEYARRGGVWRYLAGLVLLALGLAAKPMLVSAPLLLLLVDRWPLARREPWRRLVLEKIPHFALAAASCAVTLAAQRASGATALVAEVAPFVRVENALASLGAYLFELILPVRLSPFVPHPALVEAEPARALLVPCVAGAAATALLVGLAWRLRARAQAALVGLGWWLVALVPVLGLVQVGFQARADRYTYLPSAGLAFALVFALDELLRGRERARLLAAGAGVLALAALSAATVRQIAVWKDPQTLWAHALATSERNFLAHTNLGNLHARAGDLERAREHYEASLAILPGKPPHDPGAAATHYNLAGIHAMQGRLPDAARELEASLALHEAQAEAHAQLGRIAIDLGDDARAVPHLRRALELEPARPDAAERLAWVLATSSRPELRDGAEAVELARRACQAVQFGRPEFLETLAAAQAEVGDFPKAVRWQGEALQLLQGPARRTAAERLEGYRAGKSLRRGDRDQPR